MSSRDDRRLDYENRAAEAEPSAIEQEDRPGAPSPFACPDCGGVLWEIENEQMLRFRCRVGHAYSVESLLASQTDGLDAALWSALRALEEKASLSRRLAARATEQVQHGAARHFAEQATAAEEHANTIRDVLLTESQAVTPATVGTSIASTGPFPGETGQDAGPSA